MNKVNQSKLPIILACGGMAGMVGLIITRMFFIGYYQIPQNGMYPGLPAGSIIFTDKRAFSDPSEVKRGDIIVFVHKENGNSYNSIWRVAGLPGDKVEAAGESLVINGQAVKRQRVREADGKVVFREQIGDASYEIAFDQKAVHQPLDASVTVPAGQFFVMGDNRFDARDSRYFGPISFGSIIGRKL